MWLIDAGNSRLKLQQRLGGRLCRAISLSWSTENELYVQSLLSNQTLLFSSVVKATTIEWISLKASCVYQVDARLVAQVGGFHSNYTKVTQLGVDRLLISYAAYCLYPSVSKCMVVSMGTATTIELVEQGRHCGGYIAPGIGLLYQSLASTAKLPHLPVTINQQLGLTTQKAIDSGITSMQRGFIREVQLKHNPDVMLITGGYASTFATLHANVKVKPNLLFYALQQLAMKLKLED